MLKTILSIIICLSLGGLISALFYYFKNRDLFGGFIGGLVIGFIGSLIGGLLLNEITIKVFNFLSENKSFDVNIISGLIGGYTAVYIMNKLNHDRERKKY